MKKGVYTALITPFLETGEINFNCLDRLIEYQLEHNIKGLVILGSTGEANLLTQKEKIEIVKFVMEKVNGKIPVIAGISDFNILESINMAEEFKKYNIDGVLLTNPPYIKGNPQGVLKYFETIINYIKLPTIIYNVPDRTSYNIPLSVLKTLLQNKYVIGIKEASGNLKTLEELINFTDKDIFTGNDIFMVESMILGAKGVISVVSNLIPNEIADIVENISMDKFEKYKKLINILSLEPNPIMIKSALNYIGFETKTLRLPLYFPELEHYFTLTKELDYLGI